MYEWDSFLWSADEWLVSYSVPPLSLPSVKMFSVGHALELYLKAANTKMTRDIGRAIGFGHDIKNLWDDCKHTDAAFMPSYEIDDTIFSASLFKQQKLEKELTREQWLRFLHNQELYVVARFLPQLKYLGAPPKREKGPFSFACVVPNPYWARLFKEMRLFLGYPRPGRHDIIRVHMEEGNLPASSIAFLAELSA